MAISNFAELKTAVQDWIDDASLAAKADDFITLAEAQLNRVLRVADMETRAQAVTNSEYAALPTDFLSVRSIHVEGSPDKVLTYISPQQMWSKLNTTASGTPTYYTIADGQFRFAKSGTQVTVEIIYYAKIPALSATNTTNWLLTAHPDVYLFASLLQAEFFLVNDERLPLIKTKLDEIIREINRQGSETRHGGGPLTIRTGVKECL